MRLIDADRLEHFIQEQAKKYGWFTNEFSCEYIIGLIENAPTIEAEPIRHGHWKEFDDDTNSYECSVCGEVWTLNAGKPKENMMYFCSRCGAKMDEEAKK